MLKIKTRVVLQKKTLEKCKKILFLEFGQNGQNSFRNLCFHFTPTHTHRCSKFCISAQNNIITRFHSVKKIQTKKFSKQVETMPTNERTNERY